MVIASHIIFTAYGFWLPNDPRGSWSDFVRSWELAKVARATKTNERRSVAHDEHDLGKRLEAKSRLVRAPVIFTGHQALTIAKGFKQAVEESSYQVLACSIMPDHVHAVVARHVNPAERIIGHLKTRATQALERAGLHPFAEDRDADGRFPSVWAHRGWKVFLNNQDDVASAMKYVEENPVKDGLRSQKWSFVVSR